MDVLIIGNSQQQKLKDFPGDRAELLYPEEYLCGANLSLLNRKRENRSVCGRNIF